MGCRKLSYYQEEGLGKNYFFSGVSSEKRATELFFGVDYYPYGKILREWNPNAEKYLTTHHERDQETGLDYRGARYYDSDVARFLSLDPASAEYTAWSDYVYVADNPVAFVDSDGKRFKIHYTDNDGKKHKINIKTPDDVELLKNIDNDFVKDVYTTLTYLQDEGIEEINEAIGLKKTVHIKEGATMQFQFGTSQKTITFKGNSGLEIVEDDQVKVTPNKRKGTGKIQSPALGFLHEVAHFIGYAKDKAAYMERKRQKDPLYHDKEEKRVIEKIENPAADKLGEPKRTNHSGKPVNTKGPTSTEKESDIEVPSSVRDL